ncbi:hypothetical protein Q1695_005515 [Nippostrongylus brasiliensis]|nr:hypothetical protein Q1695_005515 [Nippostrongylus brasiliensis]
MMLVLESGSFAEFPLQHRCPAVMFSYCFMFMCVRRCCDSCRSCRYDSDFSYFPGGFFCCFFRRLFAQAPRSRHV